MGTKERKEKYGQGGKEAGKQSRKESISERQGREERKQKKQCRWESGSREGMRVRRGKGGKRSRACVENTGTLACRALGSCYSC